MTERTIIGTGLAAFGLLCALAVSTQLQPIMAAVERDAAEGASGGPEPSGAAVAAAPTSERASSDGRARTEPALAMSSEVGGSRRAGRDWQAGATQSEIDRILAERGIQFEADGSRLSAAGQRTVDRLVSLLVVEPDAKIRIVSHSSAGGADAAPNTAQPRASAVRQYLVDSGIAAERIRAEGPEAPTGTRDDGTIEIRLEEVR